jgi:glucokinase
MATQPERIAEAPGAVRVGLDIGGSSIKAVASPAHGAPRVIHKLRSQSPGEAVIDDLVAAARAVAAGAPLMSVGLTVPGIVQDGIVRACTNVPQLVGLDVVGELSFVLGVPVTVMNDGLAAALAEARLGSGDAAADVFVAVLGTGVAGAHVLDGVMLPGTHGQAGELGHVRVPESSAPCSCGAIGCLETVIGAPALTAAWERATGQPGDLKGLQAAALGGHEAAQAILERAAQALASAMLVLSALVDPGRLIVGGGVAEAHPQLPVRAAELARQRATFHHLPELVPAAFGGWSGAVGALLG